MTLEQGVLIGVVCAIMAIAAALLRIDSTMSSLKDSQNGLNTNILLLIQQITLEAKRSRDDVIGEMREREHRERSRG